jgi:hypothetical protein
MVDPQDFKFANLRPPCSKCGRILTRIEPGKPGAHLQTYYCSACESTEVIVGTI